LQISHQLLILPNRVLIANVKNMGRCPCPRCKVKLTEVRDLGKAEDNQRRADKRGPTPQLFRAVKKARKAIFKGYKVSGSRVEKLLGGWSRIPTNVSAGTLLSPPNRVLITDQERLHELHPQPQCTCAADRRPPARG
jgi:hypothetical protein